jgi:FkbM family methyltransferase
MKAMRLIEALMVPGAFKAAVGWPIFSLSAFQICGRLVDAGVAPRTVIDVGANRGQFAVAATRMFAGSKVFAIEPDKDTAAQLRRNVDAATASRIAVTAVGDTVGTAVLHVNTDSQVSSLLELGEDRVASFPLSQVKEHRRVPITTLDELFGGVQLEEPILLKIDVQGSEDKVIAGGEGLLRMVKWILVEVSFADLYCGEKGFAEMLGILSDRGFRFLRPMNFHTSPRSGAIIEMDALFAMSSV